MPLRVESVDLGGAKPGVSVNDALTCLQRFLIEKKPHGIVVGPYRSEVLLPAIEIVAQHRVPLLGTIGMSAITQAKVLETERYKYIFRIGLNTQYLVEYLIDTMKFFQARYGFNKVYFMIQDVAWARTTVSQMVKLYIEQSEWQVIGADIFAPGSSDFNAGLEKASYQHADIIIPFFDRPESGELVKQWKETAPQCLLFGFVSPLIGPTAWHSFDRKIAGALTVVFELGNIQASRWELAMTFFKAYQKKFGTEIESGHGPAPAYESVYIISDAIHRAGSLDPEEIVDALELTDRTGAMGRVRFHRGHQAVFGNDPNENALACIVQWQPDGRRKIIYPLSIAESDIKIPIGSRQ